MTNKYRNEVTVTLNGTDYKLRPTFEAIAEIEASTGIAFFKLVGVLMAGELRISHALAVLEHGSTGAGIKVDLNKLKEDMLAAGIEKVVEGVGSFMTAAVNGGDEAGKD